MYDYRQDDAAPIRSGDDPDQRTPFLLQPAPLAILIAAVIVAFCRVAVALGW